mmetsp:Transcript_23564/g.50123  ORF Transcript_23564/g.50123 Transcript_23564/m.50123 type:complete len:297 (-) Transcript_23564:24-914(-)
MSISSSESKFIIEGCRDGCRVDGRSRRDFRLYSSVVGDFALSHGSARIFLATKETHILVSIKAELVVPASYAPTEGAVEVHVDYMQGNKNNRDDDLESTLSNLLVPHLVDKKKLCIAPRHFVWKLNIDIFVITSGGGSLIDACSQGIHAALQQTLLPKIKVVPASESGGNKPTIQVDSDIKAAECIPGVENSPVIVTVSLLRHRKTPVMIVDATGEEEACAFARVHVVLDRGKPSSSPSKKKREPMICALHTAGGGALPFALLQDVTSFVLEASGSLRVVVSESLHHLLQDNFSIQ